MSYYAHENLSNLKLAYYQNLSQILLINRYDNFKLVQTCNTLLNLTELLQHNIFKEIPFLESLKDVVRNMRPDEKPIPMPFVSITYKNKEMVFNFILWIHPKHSNLLIVLIEECDWYYKNLRQIQQERNKLYI